MSMIGVIMLMGLGVRNAMVSVVSANGRSRLGGLRLDAPVAAGDVRLRPMLMTPPTMIAGMCPIVLAVGEGGGFRGPKARAVIGRRMTLTAVKLLLVPAAYSHCDDLGAWAKSMLMSTERARVMQEGRMGAGLAEPVREVEA